MSFYFLIKLSSILVIHVLWFVGGAPHAYGLSTKAIRTTTDRGNISSRLSSRPNSMPLLQLDRNPRPKVLLDDMKKDSGDSFSISKMNFPWKSDSNLSVSFSDFFNQEKPKILQTNNPSDTSSLPKPNLNMKAGSTGELEAMEKVQQPITKEIISSKRPKVKSKEEINLLNLEEANSKSTITFDKDYTPREIAEYIFWTGTEGERRVTIVINDLIVNSMLSKDDTINFLEKVESELSVLRKGYEEFLLESQQHQSQYSPATQNPIT